MARKLVAKAGLGEIFSTDDFFIDLAGRYKKSLFVMCTLSLWPRRPKKMQWYLICRYKFQPGLLGEAHSENQRKVCFEQPRNIIFLGIQSSGKRCEADSSGQYQHNGMGDETLYYIGCQQWL